MAITPLVEFFICENTRYANLRIQMHCNAFVPLKIELHVKISWKQPKYPNSNGVKFPSLIQVTLQTNGERHKRQNQNKTQLSHMMFYGTPSNLLDFEFKMSSCLENISISNALVY